MAASALGAPHLGPSDIDTPMLRCFYAGIMRKPDWGFSVAAFVAGVMAIAIVVLLVLGLRGLL